MRLDFFIFEQPNYAFTAVFVIFLILFFGFLFNNCFGRSLFGFSIVVIRQLNMRYE